MKAVRGREYIELRQKKKGKKLKIRSNEKYQRDMKVAILGEERIKLKLRILSIFFPDLTGRRLKIFEKIWTGIKITSSKKCQARISESGGIRIQIKRKLRPRSSINTYGRVGSLTSHIKIPVFAGLVRQDG